MEIINTTQTILSSESQSIWRINSKPVPSWINDLIDRELLINKGPTAVTDDVWLLKRSLLDSEGAYLYSEDFIFYYDNKIGIIYSPYHNVEKLFKEVPMKKIFCDRCGEEINKFGKNCYSLEVYNEDDDYFPKKLYLNDMCENCYNSLKKWFKEGKNG